MIWYERQFRTVRNSNCEIVWMVRGQTNSLVIFFFMWSKCWMYSIACYFCVSLTYAHYLCLTLSCTVFSIICNRIRWNKCIYKHTKKWYVRGSRFAQISIFSLLLFDVFFFFFISKMSTITNEEKSTNDPTLLLAQYLS